MGLSLNIRLKRGTFQLSVSLETDSLITGLLGASGCGKSMTLRCIAGIETPDEGYIILNGETLFDSSRRINLPPQKRRVGYLFQQYALFPHMTVEQNILTGLSKETNKKQKQQIVRDLLERFSLTEVRSHKPWQLSGGQAQRTALARILASRPQMLLLDEPFSALDAYLKDQLQVQMCELLHQYGKDTLLVTHSRDEAYHMCGSIALMEEGVICTFGNTQTVFSNPQTIAGARITGCKNIFPAQKKDDFHVYVPDWGILLSTAVPVKDNLKAVGIRAHAFCTASQDLEVLPLPVIFLNPLEEPFEWILPFRLRSQNPSTPAIWWRISKKEYPDTLPDTLFVHKKDILLLY